MAHPSASKPRNGFGSFSPDRFGSLRVLALLVGGWLLASGAVGAQSITTTSPVSGEPQAPTPTVHDLQPKPFRANPNPTPPPAEIAAGMDKFFRGLMTGEVRTSFSELLAGTKLAGRDENVNLLIDKTQQALSLYGKMNDYEVYDTRFIGTRTLVVTYLAALQIQPLRWRFIYYKADKNWTLINLRVDDSMEDLLE